MADPIRTRLRHAWNAFLGEPGRISTVYDSGPSSFSRPDRLRIRTANERSIIMALYNRIAMDVAAITLLHARVDENGRYSETISSGLNNILTLEANLDQTARAFIQDIVLSMFDEGCIAVVPVDTTINPFVSGSYDIQTMRTGKIVEWYPSLVRVRVYNERKGIKEEITLPKSQVAIIENPLYAVMNEPNSTFQRLIRKLNILDAIDEQSGSGKLDIIIQLPYIVKTVARQQQAEDRRKAIEMQLAGSKYGIAYTDGTEKITQLNRPTENNLMDQIKYLTSMLYSQLGVTEEVFTGKADTTVMLNYEMKTVLPLVLAILDEFERKFLTKTARSQGQSLVFFRDVFSVIPPDKIADMADKLTRNEIMSSNEFRSVIGLKPSKDPKADELRNKNLNAPEGASQTGGMSPLDTTGEVTPDLIRDMMEQ